MYGLLYILVITVCVLLWIWKKYQDSDLGVIPGPRGLPIVGVTYAMKPVANTHLILSRWAQKYGPVLSFKTITSSFVVISDFDSIYEVCVRKGMVFGGRSISHRAELCTGSTGILCSTEADEVWKALRKASQKHLRQFGDGMSKLESVFTEVAENMFDSFSAHCGQAVNPKPVVSETALYSITLVITGHRAERVSHVVEKMREYEKRLLEYCSPFAPLSMMVLDFAPWLRWFRIPIAEKIDQLMSFEDEIWENLKALNSRDEGEGSLSELLLCHAKGTTNLKGQFSEIDAKKTVLSLLFAGVTTTSNSFYAMINILAHHLDIQYRMFREIQSVCGAREASLKDKPRMPYTRACVLELLRYTSIAPLSVPHRATRHETIQGYHISQNTRIQINLWHLHHDPHFWDDPDGVLPQRFLQADGNLVPADHPHRKHLMPFGAGPRVCLGETLAQTRLFLWLTTLVSRFTVEPAPGNLKSSSDPQNFMYQDILIPCPYKVVFHKRASTEGITDNLNQELG